MERLRTQIRMLGHAMEAINYARLHKLFTLTADQQNTIAGRRTDALRISGQDARH